MAVFSNTKKPTAIVSERETSPEVFEEPKRPGTSGTELFLTTNRRTASAQYLAAQRAEQTYKAKKRAEGARNHRAGAAGHFEQSGHHLKEGCMSSWAIVAAIPWMFRGWRERKHAETEKNQRAKDLEKKKKLEEKLATQCENDEEEGKRGVDVAA